MFLGTCNVKSYIHSNTVNEVLVLFSNFHVREKREHGNIEPCTHVLYNSMLCIIISYFIKQKIILSF